MKGIIGKFFFPFGITVAVAVLVSLFVSFTLDPMLSSIWRDPPSNRLLQVPVLGHLMRATDRLLDVLHGIYERLIHWIFSARRYRVLVPPVPACGHPFDADRQARRERRRGAGASPRSRRAPIVLLRRRRQLRRARSRSRRWSAPSSSRRATTATSASTSTLPVGTSLDARQRQAAPGRGGRSATLPEIRMVSTTDRRHRQRQPQLGAAVDPADQAARAQAQPARGREGDPRRAEADPRHRGHARQPADLRRRCSGPTRRCSRPRC